MNKPKNMSDIRKRAFVKSIPIMCSYIFLSIAYGMMMQNAGLPWFYSMFASAVVYTGAFQFVLITFLSSGASIATIVLTALLMNSRQIFYSISYIETFRKMGKRKLYMIHSLTDETYAVNYTILEDEDREDVMFYVALYSWLYWIGGSILGGIIGQLIPFELKGIDFCMTALFVIIFIDRWESTSNHKPALLGLGAAVLCLIIFGPQVFMLPSLLLVSGVLLVSMQFEHGKKEGDE